MIEVLLGGENRQLTTNLGALRRIQKITGKDPFKWVSNFSGADFDTIEAIEAAISAGLGNEVVTADVKEMIDNMEAAEALNVLTLFINAAFGVEEPKPEPGEVKTPAHK